MSLSRFAHIKPTYHPDAASRILGSKSYATYKQKQSELNALMAAPAVFFWRCDLFGEEDGIVIRRKDGEQPNWFWRTMQYFVLGNKWTKIRHRCTLSSGLMMTYE